jgi:hypothetical protein
LHPVFEFGEAKSPRLSWSRTDWIAWQFALPDKIKQILARHGEEYGSALGIDVRLDKASGSRNWGVHEGLDAGDRIIGPTRMTHNLGQKGTAD